MKSTRYAVELKAFVNDRQSHFLLKVQADSRELIGEARAAGAFEDPGTEGSMNLYGRADN